MTPAEFHELQLRRMALALDKLNVQGTAAASQVLREAADWIASQNYVAATYYQWLRDDPRADVRIIGEGKRSGESLDETMQKMIGLKQ